MTSGNQPGVYITQGNFELVNVATSRPADSPYVMFSDKQFESLYAVICAMFAY